MTSPLTMYRVENSLRLEDLATTLGVDKSQICRWEKRGIPLMRVIEVERATGISRAILRPDFFGDAQ